MLMKNLRLTLLALAALLAWGTPQRMAAVNPFLPLWEYIPDGEPYVFEDPDRPGHYRVYVYGSHDSMKTEYCGREQVVWSAPVENLNDWRYGGIIFESKTGADGQPLNEGGIGDILYAPDIVEVKGRDGKKTYYLYPNNQSEGRKSMVARADRPDGPFTACNWSKDDPKRTEGVLDFDPAVMVDDDGRVYAYWGFEQSWAAELDPQTMATVKPGTEAVKDMIPNYKQEGVFRFFEASSIRKIKDKYVFIYSRWTAENEFGLPDSNYTLAYAYSDSPLGPFTPAEAPFTPADWDCLDATLYMEGDGAYTVFCHEWVQCRDGEMCLARLRKDFAGIEGAPRVLFRASEAPWTAAHRGDCYITDGPFLHRLGSGKLLMLWSSAGRKGYAMGMAVSEGGIGGPWRHIEEPLFAEDGGHGMVFRFRGKTYVCLHCPNEPHMSERPRFFEAEEREDRLVLLK